MIHDLRLLIFIRKQVIKVSLGQLEGSVNKDTLCFALKLASWFKKKMKRGSFPFLCSNLCVLYWIPNFFWSYNPAAAGVCFSWIKEMMSWGLKGWGWGDSTLVWPFPSLLGRSQLPWETVGWHRDKYLRVLWARKLSWDFKSWFESLSWEPKGLSQCKRAFWKYVLAQDWGTYGLWQYECLLHSTGASILSLSYNPGWTRTGSYWI